MISIAIGFLDISMHTSSLFNSVVGLVLVRTITVVISCFISRYIKSIKSNFSVPKIYYLAFSVILFGTLYLFFSSLGNNSISLYNVAIGGLILIIVNITMIVVDEKIYESILARREKDMLIQQNIAYENQASIINQSSETIRSLNHDMKNHLIILNKLYLDKRKDEIEEYIDKVISQMDDISLSKSNNFVIDSIINFKLQKILNKNVDIKLDIKIPEIINILAFDITIILGNLLDNAITAIEQSSNKMLDLRISYNLGNLIIFIDNSFDGNLIVKKDKLKTTKSAYTNHGMGIDNVEKSLKNYGGEIRIKHTDKIFSVSVIIPYKN
ncbi:MAG: GHKL domain-containing protein [Oscillospiraceae bacterium]|nr:GHKL domain-containing protein [Oscillospiraceae bacterium]